MFQISLNNLMSLMISLHDIWLFYSPQMHNLSSVTQGSFPWSFWLTHTAQFKSLQSALAQTDPVKHDTGHCSNRVEWMRTAVHLSLSLRLSISWHALVDRFWDGEMNACWCRDREREAVFLKSKHLRFCVRSVKAFFFKTDSFKCNFWLEVPMVVSGHLLQHMTRRSKNVARKKINDVPLLKNTPL